MANAGLVFLGLLFLGGTYYIANSLSQTQNDCRSLLGRITTTFDREAARQCEQAANLLSMAPLGYLIGAGLFLAGLVTGGNKVIIVQQPQETK